MRPCVMTGPSSSMPVRSPFNVCARNRLSRSAHSSPSVPPEWDPLGEVHQLQRHAFDLVGPRPVHGKSAEQLRGVLQLDVVVLPSVGDQDRGADVAGVPAVVALDPEVVVVGVAAVAVLGVLRGVALGGPGAHRVREVPAHRIGGDGLAEPEVEREGRVEPLVAGNFRVEEVAHAVAVGVAVPAADRRDRHDRLQLRHLLAARRDHRGGGAVVGAADHRDVPVGPGEVREVLHDVDARLLLGRAAVVPATGRPAGAQHVGHRAGVALRDVNPAERVPCRFRLAERVVRRVGEEHRLLHGVEARVPPDLHPDHRVTDGVDVVDLVGLPADDRRSRVLARAGRRRGQRGGHSAEEERRGGEDGGGPGHGVGLQTTAHELLSLGVTVWNERASGRSRREPCRGTAGRDVRLSSSPEVRG